MADIAGGVEIPADPNPNGYLPNPYVSELEAAFAYLRNESVSTDGWQDIDTKDGIVMEKKYVPDDSSAIPIVRGRGLIKSISPAAFLSTAAQPSVRHEWDPRFESGALLARYSRRAYKFYSVQKGVGMFVYPRDIVGVMDIVFPDGGDSPDGGFEMVQTSVLGDPDNSGRVRATLTCAGWSVKPKGEDLDVTYIVKINPNGSIPSAVVARIVQDIPLSVHNVAKYIEEKGHPPYITDSLISSLKLEIFRTSERSWEATFLGGDHGEEFHVIVDPKAVGGGGWSVEATGGRVKAEKQGETSAIVTVPSGAGAFAVKVKPA